MPKSSTALMTTKPRIRFIDPMKKALRAYFEAPFKVLAVLVGIYGTNRGRVKRLMAKPQMHDLFRTAVVITALVWIGIWLFVGNEYEGRLTEAVKELFSGVMK
jgi:hypothetical protein